MLFRNLFAIAVLSGMICRVSSAELFAHGGLDSQFISNTYMDMSSEWDWVEQPDVSLEVDFARFWAVGYSGRMELYARHSELFFHGHDIYALVNPTFGPGDRNDFLLMVNVGTQKNTDTFEAVNLLVPQLEMSLGLEPNDIFYWLSTVTSAYRWYYRNVVNSSLDTWVSSALTVSLPFRMSIAPRVALGYRYYPDPLVQPEEPFDLQLKPGVRVAQGTGENSGIWVDYEYLFLLNNNNMVVGELQNAEMNYVGDAFLYSGHSVQLGMKRLWGRGWQATMEVAYHKRWFGGLEVLDDVGATTGIPREDDRIVVGGGLQVERAAGRTQQLMLSMGLRYEYMRQLSNDFWYDTNSHSATLQLSFDL